MDPGALPAASATTTLRRTEPLRKCNKPAGILVKKLMRGVRTYSNNRGHAEAEDENRQKENTAAEAGHPDQGARDETDSDFDCEQSDHNCDPDSGPGG